MSHSVPAQTAFGTPRRAELDAILRDQCWCTHVRFIHDSLRRQLTLRQQLCLVFADMPRAQTIRSAVEVASKIFNCMDVRTYGIFRMVTTLEINGKPTNRARRAVPAFRPKLLPSPSKGRA